MRNSPRSVVSTVSASFPWRIFLRISVLNFILVFLGTISTLYFVFSFSETSIAFGTKTFITGISILLSLLALGLVFSFLLTRPFKRLISRARLDSEHDPLSRDPLSNDAYGEWSELESSIENIRRELSQKAETLNQEQEELTTLMSAISDAILAVDLTGKPLFYNTRFSVIFDTLSSVLKNQSIRLWEIFRAPEILEAYDSALKKGQPGQVNAFAYEVEDRPRRFLSLSVSPLRKRDGSIYGAVGIFHDVTELKSAEQIRIDFVANVSHELRTPLTSIKGYTDTVYQDFKQGKTPTPEFLDVILRNVDRLMALINDLLDLSSLESSDVLNKTKIETQEITERVLTQLESAFKKKSQTVLTEFATPTVLADPKRLEQVLVNLLDNANKYTPAGGKITVRWEATASQTVLKVKDSGPGIPQEHLPRLFERFYRVDKARSREQGGTGLGLAIVKHILNNHHGHVHAESILGQGSTFVCEFPKG